MVLDRSFLFQLERADYQVREWVRAHQDGDLRLGVRLGWQKRMAAMLYRSPRVAAFTHLHRKPDRWGMGTLPGHRPGKALGVMRLLSPC